jgi:hypothetical protein
MGARCFVLAGACWSSQSEEVMTFFAYFLFSDFLRTTQAIFSFTEMMTFLLLIFYFFYDLL